jgi:DNA-binding response OmpR family regulator
MSKPTNILLIEDNPGDVRIIIEKTKRAQFTILHSEKLSDGIKRLKEEPIELVLLDLTLPDSQGIETFTRLYAKVQKVPIVILTGCDDEELGIKSIQKGAQDYLVKGQITDDMLVRVLRYAIERSSLQNELEEIRRKQQEKEEKDEFIRNQNNFVAISNAQELKGIDKLPKIENDLSEELKNEYRQLVLGYIRALRLREPLPRKKVREFSERLTGLKLRAGNVLHIHVSFLEEISSKITPSEERAFSNDSRLVLIELLGNMMDILLAKQLVQ